MVDPDLDLDGYEAWYSEKLWNLLPAIYRAEDSTDAGNGPANGGNEEYYFGSSDWMPRNLDRRVEAVAPVDDPELRARLCSLLGLCLADNRLAWDLASDGTYSQRQPGGDREIATHELLIGDPWGLSAFTERETPAEESDAGEAGLQSALPSSSS